MRTQFPEQTKEKLNSEIVEGSFIWVDDGKNDFLGTTVLNNQTGEITEHKP